MDIEGYLALAGVKARNTLTKEVDIDVIRGVAQRDPRRIVTETAVRRLRVLGAAPAKPAEAVPEEEEPEVQAPLFPQFEAGLQAEKAAQAQAEETARDPWLDEPLTKAEAEVVKAAAEGERIPLDEPIESAPELPAPPAPDHDPVEPLTLPARVHPLGASRHEVALAVGHYTCRKCKQSKPVDEFSTRRVDGKLYMQPYCKPCKSVAKRKS